jgi:hypothetical protein
VKFIVITGKTLKKFDFESMICPLPGICFGQFFFEIVYFFERKYWIPLCRRKKKYQRKKED